MSYQAGGARISSYVTHRYVAANSNNMISCDWSAFREQILQQWDRLTDSDLENTGHDRALVANLIQNKYGISSQTAENYLQNFERTLPTMNGAFPMLLDLKR